MKINISESSRLTLRSQLKRGSQRKLHDESGNEINQQDSDIMNDLAQG
ncbi:MAG: hypothetical protein M3530_04680 [Thermoproteota archaeon]|nr:hypothetical protein [Thermoproteota archaeon]